MVFKRTLCVRVNRVCEGKSREDIVSEVAKAFSQPLVAVQIGSDTIRVTFRDVESFRTAHAKTHVSTFGVNCVVQGGGPPLTMVHIFDYPAEFLDDPIKRVLSGFGEVKNVRRQKYIGRSDIETGTRLVLMAFRVTPPRLVNIDGYFCRLWYRGQPLICNLCNVQGHKSADCPNRDKCRGCGESGHFARSCPNPWGSIRPGNTAAAPVDEFPHLPSAVRPGAGEPSAAPTTASGAGIDSVVDDACDSFLDNISIFSGSSDGSEADAAASVGDTPANGGGSDANSNLVSVGVPPPNPDDVNANDKTRSMSNKTITAASGGANVIVEAAVNSGNAEVNVEATENSGIVFNKSVAAANSGANTHSNLKPTENSGVNVNDGSADAKGGSAAVKNLTDVSVNPVIVDDDAVVTEVLSSGRVGPVPGTDGVLMDVDASLEAGLFSSGGISECSLNDAQILPSSSEDPESQSILIGVSVVDNTGPSCEVGASSSVGDTSSVAGAGGTVAGGGVSDHRGPAGRPSSSSLDDVASQKSGRDSLSRGKAKSSALLSLSRLKDRVAPAILGRSSRIPSRLPRPTVAAVVPRATRSRHQQWIFSLLTFVASGMQTNACPWCNGSATVV